MSNKETTLATKILRDLVDRAESERLYRASTARPGSMIIGHNDKPGDLIKSLGPVTRQNLKNLKSEDTKDDRYTPFL